MDDLLWSDEPSTDMVATPGSGRKNVHTSQSQVIRLTLSGSEKRLPKNNYSLDDLSDLGSKLVLITGRESSEIKDDEVFLHVSVLCLCCM